METSPRRSEDEVLKEINVYEPSLVHDPDNIDTLCRISILYNTIERSARAAVHVERAIKLFMETQLSASQGLLVAEAGLKHYKGLKYVSSAKDKGELRINITLERSKFLNDLHQVLIVLVKMRDQALGQKISLYMAYVKECLGQYQDALALLSDIITAPNHDIDLTFVILRASVLLLHIGSYPQAIEYLQYLTDEPPLSEGYTKTHVLAFLAAVYERAGEHYNVILERTYDELLDTYSKELSAGKKPLTNQKKIEGMLAKKSMSKASEIWEMLGLQCIERCEYIFASEIMLVAVEKAPTKGKLHHLLAEIYYILGEKERAAKMAEKAFTLVPNNNDLRNLLLLVDRTKWQDKLRSVLPVASKDKASADDEMRVVKTVGNENDASSTSSWMSKMTTVIESVQKDGAAATLMNLSSLTMSPAQRAKDAAIKEKKRKEKLAKKKQKEDELKAKEDADKRLTLIAQRKKRDPKVDGPARPEKPPFNEDTNKLIANLRQGKYEHTHFYDDSLNGLRIIFRKLRVDQEKKAKKAAGMKAEEEKVKATEKKKAKKIKEAQKKFEENTAQAEA